MRPSNRQAQGADLSTADDFNVQWAVDSMEPLAIMSGESEAANLLDAFEDHEFSFLV